MKLIEEKYNYIQFIFTVIDTWWNCKAMVCLNYSNFFICESDKAYLCNCVSISSMVHVVRFMGEEMIDVGLVVLRINVWSTYKLGNLSFDCIKCCICSQCEGCIVRSLC